MKKAISFEMVFLLEKILLIVLDVFFISLAFSKIKWLNLSKVLFDYWQNIQK